MLTVNLTFEIWHNCNTPFDIQNEWATDRISVDSRFLQKKKNRIQIFDIFSYRNGFGVS